MTTRREFLRVTTAASHPLTSPRRTPLRPHTFWLPISGSLTVADAGKRRFDTGRFFSLARGHLETAHARVEQDADRLSLHDARFPARAMKSLSYDGVIVVDATRPEMVEIRYHLSFGKQLAIIAACLGILAAWQFFREGQSGLSGLGLALVVAIVFCGTIAAMAWWAFHRPPPSSPT